MIPDNLRAYVLSDEIKRLEDGYIDVFNNKVANAAKAAKVRPRPLLLGAPHFRGGKGMTFPDGGPGYTFNQAALDLFATECLPHFLPNNTDPREDVFVGSCFLDNDILVSHTRDEQGGGRYIDIDLHRQSLVEGVPGRGPSPLQPERLEQFFGIKWKYFLEGISSQVVAVHLKTSAFAKDMPSLIYRYYEMMNYDEAKCDVSKGTR